MNTRMQFEFFLIGNAEIVFTNDLSFVILYQHVIENEFGKIEFYEINSSYQNRIKTQWSSMFAKVTFL